MNFAQEFLTASRSLKLKNQGQNNDFLGIAETTEILAEMYQSNFTGTILD